MKKKEEKCKNGKRKRTRSNDSVSGTAFPTRMLKKRAVDLVKACLPESPAKKVAVVAALIESPTTKKGLQSKGLIPSAKNNDEGKVAISAMRRKDRLSNVTKGQCSTDFRAATKTALGFLCGDN